MGSRWVNLAVIVLWLAAMSWLVKSKVLPTFETGNPPDCQEGIDAQASKPPVGWKLGMNDRSIGWALTTTTRRPDGRLEVESLVHFDELPLGELTPAWLQTLLRLIEEPSLQQAMDARSVLHLDANGLLTHFESTVSIAGAEDIICLKGKIVGNKVTLSVQSGEFLYRSELFLPAGALLGDALQPQTRLPGLFEGQTWTVPVYSPLRPPHSPMEILHAEVAGDDLLPWNGRMERVWLVVYTSDPGAGLINRQEARGKLWVSRDGDVLRQEVSVFGSKLAFARLPIEEAIALQQVAEAGRIPHVAPAPTHEEVWPLDWPASPFQAVPASTAPAASVPASAPADP